MKSDKFIYFSLAVLILLNSLAWIAVFNFNKPRLLEVDFFNIGQGDAIFVETPQRHRILIDGGPSSKILEKLGAEMVFYGRSLDMIILTHPDPDHLLGLIDVIKRYKISLIGFTGVKSSRPEFVEFYNQILKNKIPKVILKKNNRVWLGEDIYIDILSPLEDFEGKEVQDYNPSSIAAKLVFGKNSFLFTGDIPKSTEEKLVNDNSIGRKLDSDILKVSHHGSKTSTGESFIRAVSPEIAVISVGGYNPYTQSLKENKDCDNKEANKYGHPHCEVLERLQKFDIKVLRTDKNGDVKFFSDGNNYKYLELRN